MNGEIEEEAPRPRPLSSGIWTLFSWFRRTDRSLSSESIGSVGSDLTVASFDFLAPFNYKHNPVIELPQSPLTDTYKKRLNERNLRRQYDRDITLRRKYGLYREEVLGFEGFSLPSTKKLQRESPTRRDRRAASESFQRRAPYVPGKRRAPLPPRVNISNTLPRSYKRKKQAPRPPLTFTTENKENVDININKQMYSKNTSGKYSNPTESATSRQKIENPVKENGPKDVKLRQEKNLLKQFFDKRKRNSAIDTSHVKWLPSISELDKQAAEIIAAKKIVNTATEDNDVGAILSSNEKIWICKMCFKKYNAAVLSCLSCVKSDRNKIAALNIYTQTDNNVATSSKHFEDNEKKKLKEMLKEMKDSLPKRSHPNEKRIVLDNNNLSSTETPTLRIGSPFGISGQVKQLSNTTSSNLETKSLEDKMYSSETINIIPQVSGFKQSIVSNVDNGSKSIDERKNIEKKNTNYDSSNAQMSILNSKKYNFLMASKPKNTVDIITKVPNNGLPENNNKNEGSNDTEQLSLINKVTVTDGSKNIIDQHVSVSSGLHSTSYKINNETNTFANITSNKPSNNDNGIDITKQNTKETPIKSNVNDLSIHFKTKSYLTDTSKNKIVAPKLQNTVLANEKIDLTKNDNYEQFLLGDVITPAKVKSNETKDSSNVNLNTPLRISSLLNPLYLPRNEPLGQSVLENNTNLQTKKNNVNKTAVMNSDVSPTRAVATRTSKPNNTITNLSVSQNFENNLHPDGKNNDSQVAKNSSKITDSNQHVKRRDLINQLELAISKGDERTASEAAANLAKLKLSCSVLSFSSQIIGIVNNARKDIKNQNAIQDNTTPSVTKMNDNKEVTNLQSQLTPISKSIIKQNPCPSTSKQNLSQEMVPIEIWVEDKEATRGPIRMKVRRQAVLGDLKKQADASLGLDIRLQRWIVGKNLCTNDFTPLISLSGPDFSAPFYLCLVESDTNKDGTHKINEFPEIKNKTLPNTTIRKQESSDVYTELMKLEQQALVPNTEDFECGVCIEQCTIGNGAVLRECIHTFCRECLSDIVRHCEDPTVSCPAIGCLGTLQEREIRALLPPEEYDRWLARSLTAAESGTRNTFHCRTRDCSGWAFCEPGVRRFPCPVCKHTNCLPCQAVHEDETCEQYQTKLHRASTVREINQSDEGTQALLESLIKRGEALECPECSAIITKKWGCDWIKCSSCKTEICWVTKGRRWGPSGKGDTSGGCRCGVDGKRCHPSCGYCH